MPAEEPPRGLRVVYQDGSRYSGELQKVEKGALVLKVPGVAEMLRLPLEGLRSLVVLTAAELTPPSRTQSTGRLEIPGVRLTGKLVDGSEKPGSSCLAWQPISSETASPLAPGVSGHIIYKDPPPPVPGPADDSIAATASGDHARADARCNCNWPRRENKGPAPWRCAS